MSEKQPWEWEKPDVENLIANHRQEDVNLDYKASDSLAKTDGKKTEITKDVSSFANSDGGVIIYGISEFADPQKRHLPEKIDAGFDPTDISKEWLEQVINSGIKPKIDNLRIKPIPVENNKTIYVVHIPKSSTAHQASDKKYYKRYNFRSVAMEHYEIMDVLNRSIYPDLQPFFFFLPMGDEYHLEVGLSNLGKKVIKNYSFKLSLPYDLLMSTHGESSRREIFGNLMTVHGKRTYQFSEFTYRNTNNEFVIFPQEDFELINVNTPRQIVITRIPEDPMLFMAGKICWELFADDMPVKEGEAMVSEIQTGS